jgi:uncharacterized protein (TIGR02996 family)
MVAYTGHPEYQALLRDICACPSDDLPRLLLADWLIDHSDHVRADFIHQSIQFGIPHCAYSVPPHWLPDLPANYPDNWSCEFHRGLISSLRLTIGLYAGFAPLLFSHSPIVRILLSDVPRPHPVGTAFNGGHVLYGWDGYHFPLAEPQAPFRLWYLSPEAAIDSLSIYLVNHGRSLVGLTPIQSPNADPDPR